MGVRQRMCIVIKFRTFRGTKRAFSVQLLCGIISCIHCVIGEESGEMHGRVGKSM